MTKSLSKIWSSSDVKLTSFSELLGPIATAGGLVFIAATIDQKLRAFDIETGRELWTGELTRVLLHP